MEKGAIIRDSILFQDCQIKKGAIVDLAILDKRAVVSEGAEVGMGDGHDVANRHFPKHLYTGITLLGKRTVVPAGKAIGRNCIVHSYTKAEAYPKQSIKDGETLYPTGEIL